MLCDLCKSKGVFSTFWEEGKKTAQLVNDPVCLSSKLKEDEGGCFSFCLFSYISPEVIKHPLSERG